MAKIWTNRGLKRLVIDGDLDTATLRLAAFKGTAPATGTIRDMNVIADLEAAAGVDEAVAAGYARVNVGTITFTEDDANDRVLLDYPASASLGTPAAGETWTMIACFDNAGGADSARDLIWVETLAVSFNTNGAAATVNLTDDTVTNP